MRFIVKCIPWITVNPLMKNGMGANLKSFFNNLLDKADWASGWEREAVPAAPYFVAAGNPVAENSVASFDDVRPLSLKKFARNNIGFIVAGSSMVPKGIMNGDAIACKPLEPGRHKDITEHKFVVVRVDRRWYEKRHQNAKFDYKLRYTLAAIPVDSDFDTFYENISRKEDSVLVPSNKKELKRKYDEAIAYYGKTTPLLLSLTFKEGITHYSVHPLNLVEYEVVGLGQLQADGKWVETELPAA